MNRSNAGIEGETSDGAFKFENLGIQNLKRLEKRQVDLLGYVTEVRKERRKRFT